MSQAPKSVLEQDFELLIPYSFQKKIITALIGQELADEKILNKLNQLWIKQERQEHKALKAFLAELRSEKMEERSASAMLAVDDLLLEELLKELKTSTDEYNETYEELLNLTESFNYFDDELLTFDKLLSDSVETLFQTNTDFATNGVKASKEEQKLFLSAADQYMANCAAILANKTQGAFMDENALNVENEMEGMFKGLENALNDLDALTKLTGSGIKQRQLTDKIIGKPGEIHHEHHKHKFKAACNKAMCLNRIKLCKGKLQSISSHCDDAFHQKQDETPNPVSVTFQRT